MEAAVHRPRRLFALVRNLPPESSLMTKLRGYTWSQDTEILAIQAEMLFAVIRVLMQGFGAKKHQVPKPWSMPRPWKKKPTRRKGTPEEVIAAMEKLLGGPDG